jgi:hypothetical protein
MVDHGQGSVFNLPFKRSDVFTASFGIGNSSVELTSERRECVYPHPDKTQSHVPEQIRWTLSRLSSGLHR